MSQSDCSISKILQSHWLLGNFRITRCTMTHTVKVILFLDSATPSKVILTHLIQNQRLRRIKGHRTSTIYLIFKTHGMFDHR